MSSESNFIEWALIVILVAFSGLFSGLNLGLMGLDKVSLEIIMSGSQPNKRYAERIKPLRDKGNWLLCTLLLGNVAVNAGLSILLADRTSAILGFVVSTSVIVIFGEIIPQALCSRYALWIGSHTTSVVWIVLTVLAVVAYPIAWILDRCLGEELGTIYSKRELQKLFEIHAKHEHTSGVTERTANMMKGALDLQDCKVDAVMTSIKDVFWLSESTKLTFDVLTEIFKSGHSRIPIHKEISKENNNHQWYISGILYVKDLILLDPDDEISIAHVMNAFRYKKPLYMSSSITLDQALKIFVQSRQHIAMVKKSSHILSNADNQIISNDDEKYNSEKSLSTNFRNSPMAVRRNSEKYIQNKINESSIEMNTETEAIGIITLEDVIEHALQTELVDEHDNYVDQQHRLQTNRLSNMDWNYMLHMFDHRSHRLTNLPPQELQAVYHFLSQDIRIFMHKHRLCSESAIKNLLAHSSVIRVIVDNNSENNDVSKTNNSKQISLNMNLNVNNHLHNIKRDPYKDIENNGLLLYQRDHKTEYFTLILDGKCEIYAGRQGFRSQLARWTYLCPDALEHVQHCYQSGKPLLDYVPDFTCKVVEDSRVLRVKLSDFHACLKGQFDGDSNLQPELRFHCQTKSLSDNIREGSDHTNQSIETNENKNRLRYYTKHKSMPKINSPCN